MSDLNMQTGSVVPKYDPQNPYAYPAFMPSSADSSHRSFHVDDFPVPTVKSEEWKYAPLEKMRSFFMPYDASGETAIHIAYSDGSALDDHVHLHRVTRQELEDDPDSSFIPVDRVSVLGWNAAPQLYKIIITGTLPSALVVTVTSASLSLDSLHLFFTIEKRSQANIIVQHHGQGRLSESIDIRVKDYSTASFAFIQQGDKESQYLCSQRLTVGENARLNHSVITLSGDIARIRMDADFSGANGYLNMLGVYFADHGEYFEHRPYIVHNYPSCTSRVIYKGALNGSDTKSAWVGNALILPQAVGTDSYELNRNLLLTSEAKAESEPQLEIECGDIVGAGHASSIGHFDQEQLYYMESRGIPENIAKKLIIRGFFKELFDEIGILDLGDQLLHIIDTRLEHEE